MGMVYNLSAPAVQRRIRRMEDSRIILTNSAMVDPVSVGLPSTILIEVEMENEPAEKYDVVKRAFMATPEIQQC
jgi:DNA-binding Lrp family transcriptional regulator